MLLCGFVYEVRWQYATAALDAIACRIAPHAGLWLGFLPFGGVFATIFSVDFGLEENTTLGWYVTLFSFGAWAMYGVATIVWLEDLPIRDTAYNILDILSKNVRGTPAPS